METTSEIGKVLIEQWTLLESGTPGPGLTNREQYQILIRQVWPCLMFAVRHSLIALDAPEGIGRAILVEAEVILLSLLIFQLLRVSHDNDTDAELGNETNKSADDKTNSSTRGEE